MAARKSVPDLVQTAVLLRCARRCCLCWGLSRDFTEKRGQIAHLDHDPSNSAESNLVYLCLEHHDEYDSKTRLSKGLRLEEVRSYRNQLLDKVAATQSEPIGTAAMHLAAHLIETSATDADRFGYPGYLSVENLPMEVEWLDVQPGALAHEMSSLPPLKRETFARDQFVGRWVRWTGRMMSIHDADLCYSILLLADDGSLFTATFPPGDRPLLEDLREGDQVEITGQIRSAVENVELVKIVLTR